MSDDRPQENPQNHDIVPGAGTDKPSQAEGSEEQAEEAISEAAPTGGED
ncbi:hypothetical protein [Herbiconiux sp.]|jgi:hypothetical protein|nr:hypothetical protein [Herbiconiux sp.]